MYTYFIEALKLIWCQLLKWFLFPRPPPHSILHECLDNDQYCECINTSEKPKTGKLSAKQSAKAKTIRCAKRRQTLNKRMGNGDATMRPRQPHRQSTQKSSQVWYKPPVYPETEPVPMEYSRPPNKICLTELDRPTYY